MANLDLLVDLFWASQTMKSHILSLRYKQFDVEDKDDDNVTKDFLILTMTSKMKMIVMFWLWLASSKQTSNCLHFSLKLVSLMWF